MTGMRSRRTPSERSFTRREWTALLGAAPLAAQTVSPSTSPQAAPPNLQKAFEDVRHTSERLSKLEVPMNIEPAFNFKA